MNKYLFNTFTFFFDYQEAKSSYEIAKKYGGLNSLYRYKRALKNLMRNDFVVYDERKDSYFLAEKWVGASTLVHNCNLIQEKKNEIYSLFLKNKKMRFTEAFNIIFQNLLPDIQPLIPLINNPETTKLMRSFFPKRK